MTRWLAALAVLIAANGAGPCLAQAGPAAVAAEIDPERLALANQIIDLAYPPEGRRAMLMRASDTMTAQVRAAVTEATGRDIEAGMEEILQRFLDRMRVHAERATDEHSPAIFTAFARAYARQFTREELVEIRAFVSTRRGGICEQAVDLLSDPDVARANTAYMQARSPDGADDGRVRRS